MTQPRTQFVSTRIKRRNLFQGLGAGALFLSPIVRSVMAEANTGTAGWRLLIVPIQHGWGLSENLTQVADLTGLPGLPAFAPVQHQLNILKNVCGTYWGNAHDVSYADILTGSVRKDETEEVPGGGGPFFRPKGPSIDFVLGGALGTQVLRMSASYRSFGALFHPMSFDANRNRLDYLLSPKEAYDRVMERLPSSATSGSASMASSTPAPAATPGVNADQLRRKRIIDAHASDLRLLLGRLAGSSKERVQMHIDALATLEDELGLGGSSSSGGSTTPVTTASCSAPASPGAGNVRQNIVDFLRITKSAFLCGSHRVAVLGIGEGEMPGYTWTHQGRTYTNGIADLPVSQGETSGFHHQCAHYDSGKHPSDADRHMRHSAFRGWTNSNAVAIVNFVKELEAAREVDGSSVLDRTLIVLTGEISDGSHNTVRKILPILGGGAALKLGQFVSLPTSMDRTRALGAADWVGPAAEYSEGDLWLHIARIMGAGLTTFGDPTRTRYFAQNRPGPLPTKA